MLLRKLAATAALCGFCATATTVSANMKAMKSQIAALSKKVNKQQAIFNEELTHYIKNEINAALKDHKGGSLLTLGGSHIKGLKVKGDLRLRYENREYNGKVSKNRFRQRLRLGFTWKTNEGWEIGAGLATGDDNDTSATSTNGSYKNNFGTGSINLDYAYAKYKFENGISFTAGQHKNPFLTGTKILFDSDARFIGATIQAKSGDIFGTAGVYTLSPDTNDDAQDSLIAAQAGYSANGLTVAGAIYHFNGQDAADGSDNSVFKDEDDVTALNGLIEFKGKTDAFKYKVFGEYTVNIAADNDVTQATYTDATEFADDNNVAWALGAEIKVDKFKINYAYIHVEGDAFYKPLLDGDFGDKTVNKTADTEGHRLKLGYSLTKHSSIGVTYISAK
ncbi:MAG: putative porin, partial [Lentisphaeraceae bacterium]|nr:putative porin [Lentisphaeraceae bacterium]